MLANNKGEMCKTKLDRGCHSRTVMAGLDTSGQLLCAFVSQAVCHPLKIPYDYRETQIFESRRQSPTVCDRPMIMLKLNMFNFYDCL